MDTTTEKQVRDFGVTQVIGASKQRDPKLQEVLTAIHATATWAESKNGDGQTVRTLSFGGRFFDAYGNEAVFRHRLVESRSDAFLRLDPWNRVNVFQDVGLMHAMREIEHFLDERGGHWEMPEPDEQK